MFIYVTKNIGEITFRKLRAIGRAYDIELKKGYRNRTDVFYSPVKSERHSQAIYAFGLCLKALQIFQQLADKKEKGK